MYDGSQWINGDPTSVIAPTAYTGFYDDTPSGISNFSSFTAVPTGLPEVADTVNVGGATRGMFIEAFVTGTLARTSLSSGIWEFNHYASVDNATRPVFMAWDVFVRTEAGAEQFWFSGTSSSITTTTVTHDSVLLVEDAKVVNASDRLLIRLWAYRNNINTVNFSFYHNGGTHSSHIHTPFGVAHNDLAGLQGGQSAEYFHLTSDQREAAVGSFGAPSISNTFVTQSDPVLRDGAQARALGSGAYDLAVVGTVAANVAQGDATNALSQLLTVSAILFAGQTGTHAAFIAQVPNWKSDLPITVRNGIITEIKSSRYQYMDFLEECCGLTGTAPGDLAQGHTWGGTSAISSWMQQYYTGNAHNDPFFAIEADEFYGSGTNPTGIELNRGTGWAGAWNSDTANLLGTETWLDYPLGQIWGTLVTGGFNWSGTATIV
jgi:hypothetical protein